MPLESDVEGLGLYTTNQHPNICVTLQVQVMKMMAHRVLNHRAPVAVMDNYNLRFGALRKVKD